MKPVPIKLSEEKHETKHVLRRNAMAVYVKVTEWSLTMSGSTGEVHYRVSQLAWLVVTRTEFVNHPVINHLLR